MKLNIAIVLLTLTFSFGCKKENSNPPTDIYGTWVLTTDGPLREPADTLKFYKQGEKSIMAFYCAGSPGPEWPNEALTEFKWNGNKLVFKDYSGQTTEYLTVRSFEWIDKTHFTLKFHELLIYIARDDIQVTYQKIE